MDYFDPDQYSDASGEPGARSQTGPKKIRKNHNEFERRRRDMQRQRLEELRRSVPGLDEKASMVAVLKAAREYIDELQNRNQQLEHGHLLARGIHPTPDVRHLPNTDAAYEQHGAPMILPKPSAPQIVLGDMISPSRSPLAAQAEANAFNLDDLLGLPPLTERKSSEETHTESPKAFRKGRAQIIDALPGLSSNAPPESTVFTASASFNHLNQAGRPSFLLFIMDESFITDASKRKDSALLVSQEEPGSFLFGHRNSVSNLFNVPLPHILEPQHPAYVSCGKCMQGVQNLIMIDCDKCHRWYHIRCVGIERDHVPIRWTCFECPK